MVRHCSWALPGVLTLQLCRIGLAHQQQQQPQPQHIVSVDPETACPGKDFDVLWDPRLAAAHHWLALTRAQQQPPRDLDTLLYWCYLDGGQQPPAAPPAARGVGLNVGSAGTFTVYYYTSARPIEGAMLLPAAAASTNITVSSGACFEVTVHPQRSCPFDPLSLSWRVPAQIVAPGDRVGLFPFGARPGPEGALHWVDASASVDGATAAPQPEGKRVLRLAHALVAMASTEDGACELEARYYCQGAAAADSVSAPFTVLPASDPECGEYVTGGFDTTVSAPVSNMGAAGDTPSSKLVPTPPPPPAPPAPPIIILQTITALSDSRPIRVPHENLLMPPSATDGDSAGPVLESVSVMMWLLLLEDSTGAYRSIIYKGTGNAHRTPSLWLLPHSRQLTFQLTTTRAHEDFGVSTGTLPLCSWTHIAYHFLLPPPVQAYPYCRILNILQWLDFTPREHEI